MKFCKSTRQFLSAAFMAVGGLLSSSAALADAYPSAPIRLIVPFEAGGGTDLAARKIAQALRDHSGATVIVENRGGAGGVIGIDYVANAKPDGYTLLVGSDTLLTAPLIHRSVRFELKDFMPLVRIRLPNVFLAVSPSLPVKNVSELIALAKAQPGQFAVAHGGVGTVQHLAAVLFDMYAKTEMLYVPYKGSTPAIIDTVGGQTQITWSGGPDIQKFVSSGQLKVLAMAGTARSSLMPEVPTMAELGYPGVLVPVWNGVLAPANTPPEAAKWLMENIAAAASSPAYQDNGTALEISKDAVIKGEEFGAFLQMTQDSYKTAIKKGNIVMTE